MKFERTKNVKWVIDVELYANKEPKPKNDRAAQAGFPAYL